MYYKTIAPWKHAETGELMAVGSQVELDDEQTKRLLRAKCIQVADGGKQAKPVDPTPAQDGPESPESGTGPASASLDLDPVSRESKSKRSKPHAKKR